jgi:hypothetical protein
VVIDVWVDPPTPRYLSHRASSGRLVCSKLVTWYPETMIPRSAE